MRSAGQRIACVVDDLLREQEVLVKPFRKPLLRVRHFAGATILGNGTVAPILNVADLIASARLRCIPPTLASPPEAGLPAKTRILVVEDSITSRMMLKGILAAAGFDVVVAADGLEAYALLRETSVALVVSDVEMPRLNGFDLTARIRADKRLAELPVVLVTALESREQRERGMDVGANAYLTKSNFAQNNLLDVVRRLI
jgi:two-component system chemotaxis sensor kinase CheA